MWTHAPTLGGLDTPPPRPAMHILFLTLCPWGKSRTLFRGIPGLTCPGSKG